ncbi:MAG: hypothetical protein LWX51_09330 [Deltaproteobacteria bacterium]|nr:hypothetical protein [Deltaproteobacteria bacterium]
MLECWDAGILEYWNAGIKDNAGMLEYWNRERCWNNKQCWNGRDRCREGADVTPVKCAPL